MTTAPDRIVVRGRPKAYRPLPAHERSAAIARGIEAYDRGDWFLAHELLEPAWMGTADPGERDLLQGLIKLSASFVHAVRINVEGQRKNLVGARALLAEDAVPGAALGLDPRLRPNVVGILSAIDDRLALIDAGIARPILEPIAIHDPGRTT